MVHAINRVQLARKSKIFCLTDAVCINLLDPECDDAEFAAKLFRSFLGFNFALWPKAVVMTMHLDDTHFCTLLLIATVRKLYVFDSLTTSESSRKKIGLLAKRLRITVSNVEYCPMVMQKEDPYVLCMDFSLGVTNAVRQGIVPKPVSCSFFVLFCRLVY